MTNLDWSIDLVMDSEQLGWNSFFLFDILANIFILSVFSKKEINCYLYVCDCIIKKIIDLLVECSKILQLTLLSFSKTQNFIFHFFICMVWNLHIETILFYLNPLKKCKMETMDRLSIKKNTFMISILKIAQCHLKYLSWNNFS